MHLVSHVALFMIRKGNGLAHDSNASMKDYNLMNDIRYPQEGSQLLIAGAESTFMPTFERIPASGYLKAGHVLVEHLLTTGRKDSLVHPVLFCYRQYLELALKDINRLVNSINGTAYDPFEDRHNLQKSWNRFRSLTEAEIVEAEGPEGVSILNTVEGFILELTEFDSRGTLFRYQYTEPKGYKKQRNISLPNLRDRMHETANWFDSLYDWWEATFGNE